VETRVFEKQLTEVLKEFAALRAKAHQKDLSDLPKNDRQALVTRAIAAIRRISGTDSTYAQEIERLLSLMPEIHAHTSSIMGVAQALLDDIQAGHIQSLVEIVRGDLFSDFLEMAEHLCDSKYKDAAAVIAGATLENHIRALCRKSGLSIQATKPDGSKVPKKTDTLNSELAGAKVYSKLDQKSVTAWLDLRNSAAHGHYAEYQDEQVVMLIAFVRNFVARVPA
jgi:hypothetical protein